MDDSMIGATQALDFSDQDDVTDDEQDKNKVVAHLNVPCQKGFAGKLFPLHQGDNMIGRGESCGICIPLKGLSREHACIEIQGDSHFIYDKGSRNRTKRNKHYLAASVRYELKDKDALTFGDVDCTYQMGEESNLDMDDSGSETGSESMLPTGLVDQELGDDETIAQSKLLADGEEDEGAESDASSDILQPTQPSANATHMQSMMRSKFNGDSYLDPNNTAQVTVMETPATSRSKKLMGNLSLPESDEDTTDGEDGSSVPKLGTMVVADSQDGDEEEEPEEKSALIGAATQAYVYESDVTTDGEQTPQKKSLLMQPTQAYGDSDISTCDEESPQKSPQKKAFLTAATQAYTMDEEITSKKKRSISPVEATVAYNMEKGVEPTQAYDMEEEEEEKKTDRGASILYEPTQAYHAPSDTEDKKDENDGDSDSSEEFILDGDTEGEEDDEEARQMMVAPTLTCDTQAPMETDDPQEDKTQPVEDTQVFETAKGDQADTQVFTETDATQVIEDKVKQPKHGGAGDTDETQVFTEDATQVFDDKASPAKPSASHQDETQVFTDDATQVFDDGKETTPTRKSCTKDATLAIHEDATQVFDEDPKSVGKGEAKTQVTSDEATQVFDDTNKTSKDTHHEYDAIQVFTNNNNNNTKGDYKAFDKEEATQVFENNAEETAIRKTSKSVAKPEVVEETQTFTDDNEDEAEFDINAMSTLAAPDPAAEDEDTEGEVDDGVKPAANEEETQVFETAASTFDVQDIGAAKSAKESKKATTIHEDATQVFDEDPTAPVADETVAVENEPQKVMDKKDKRNKKSAKGIEIEDPTLDISDIPTQAIDEEVKVSEAEATVHIQDSGANEIIKAGKKGRRGKQSIAKQAMKKIENPTQLLDTTAETDSTLPVTEVETLPITEGETQPITEGETVPITEGETLSITEGETLPITEDATMQIDEEVESDEIKDDLKGKSNKKVIQNRKQKEKTKDETGMSTVEEPEIETTVKTGRGQRIKKKTEKVKSAANEDSAVEAATVPVSDTVAIEDVVGETVQPRRGGRRGAPLKETKEKQNISKIIDKELEKDDDKQSRGRRSRASKVVEETKATADDTNSSERGPRRKTTGKETVVDTADKQEGSAADISEKVDDRKNKQTASGRRGKKGKGESKKEEPVIDTEPETQVYGIEGTTEDAKQTDEAETQRYGDEAATQRYGEEEPTQRYIDDEDSTPDIAELGLDDEEENDSSPIIPKPALVPIPSRSPLKSALASPEKKRDKSPSPRRVKFVSQSSNSSTESTTRPKRGRHKIDEAEPETKKGKASKKKNTDNEASVAPSRGTRRGKKVTTDDTTQHEEKTRRSRQGKKTDTDTTAEDTIEHEKKTRPSRGSKKTETETTVDDTTQHEEKTKTSIPGKKINTDITAEDATEHEDNARLSKGGKKPKSEPVALLEIADEEVQETRKSGRARGGKRGAEAENEDSKIKSKTVIGNKIEAKSESVETVTCEINVGRKSARGKGKAKEKEDDLDSLEDKTEEKSIEETQTNKRSRKSAKTVNNNTESKVDEVKDRFETGRNKRTKGKDKDDKEVVNKQEDDNDKKREIKVETKDNIAMGNKRTRGKNTASDSVIETKTDESQKTESVESDTRDNETTVGKLEGKKKGKGKSKINKESEELSKDEAQTENVESLEDSKKDIRGRGGCNKKQTEETSIEKCNVDGNEKHSTKSSRQSTRGVKKVIEEADVQSADKCDISNKTDKVKSAKRKTTDVKDESKPTRATRGKRKETDAMEETESMSTPAKKKKILASQETAASSPAASGRKSAATETPKSTNKRVSAVGTPKNQGVKDLDTNVIHSPTLRKSTVSGGKAKVMFTGVVDEQGMKTVKDLGGELVSSVYECSHLVTDQIRRTVKFLCCLSRGIPIVTPQWLVSSKGGGVFSDPDPFIVSDDASEKKFKCSLRSSLAKAADKQLLTDYKIHVTKSVKPDPASMKDIIQCAGAQFLTSMPKSSSGEGNTLIISCPDDKPACEAAIKAGVPVVSAEFVLTGVLRQEADINTHQLFNSGNGSKRNATGQPAETTVTKKRKR